MKIYHLATLPKSSCKFGHTNGGSALKKLSFFVLLILLFTFLLTVGAFASEQSHVCMQKAGKKINNDKVNSPHPVLPNG
jgi:hypothetical protein